MPSCQRPANRTLPFLALLALACVDKRSSPGVIDDGGGGGDTLTLSIQDPFSIEAGARVAFRVFDPDGVVRSGDVVWNLDAIGTVEDYEPGDEEVYLVAGPATASEQSISFTFGGTTVTDSATVDPIVLNEAPAFASLPGGDGLDIVAGEMDCAGDALAVALCVDRKYAVIGRYDNAGPPAFTPLGPFPTQSNGLAVVQVKDLALADDGNTLYAVLDEPDPDASDPGLDPPARLARFTLEEVMDNGYLIDRFLEDQTFSPIETEYMAVTLDGEGHIWVAVEPNSPCLWRLGDQGEVVEAMVWPSGAGVDVTGLAVDSWHVVLSTEGSVYQLERRDETSQESATIATSGIVTDLVVDTLGRRWISVLDQDSPPSGRLLGLNAKLEVVQEWSETSSPLAVTLERPRALAVDDEGNLRILDDVDQDPDYMGEPLAAPLASIAALDRIPPVVPPEQIIIEPAGGVLYVGGRKRISARTLSGSPLAIEWDSPIGGLGQDTTTSLDQITYDAAPFIGTFPVRARLVDDPTVSRTVYFTTTAFNFRLDAPILGPGNDCHGPEAAVSSGDAIYHVYSKNGESNLGGTQFELGIRRVYFGAEDQGDPCQGGVGEDCLDVGIVIDLDLDQLQFFQPNVATDPVGNAYVLLPLDFGDPGETFVMRWLAGKPGNEVDIDEDVSFFVGFSTCDPFEAGRRPDGMPGVSLYTTANVDDLSGDRYVVRLDFDSNMILEDYEGVTPANLSTEVAAVDSDDCVLVRSDGGLTRYVPMLGGGYDAEPVIGIPSDWSFLDVDDLGRIYAAFILDDGSTNCDGSPPTAGEAVIRMYSRSGIELPDVLAEYTTLPSGGDNPGDTSAVDCLGPVLGMAVGPSGQVRLVDEGFFLNPRNGQPGAYAYSQARGVPD